LNWGAAGLIDEPVAVIVDTVADLEVAWVQRSEGVIAITSGDSEQIAIGSAECKPRERGKNDGEQ
jgi:hypothetical protein